jgi:hypothetical protein
MIHFIIEVAEYSLITIPLAALSVAWISLFFRLMPSGYVGADMDRFFAEYDRSTTNPVNMQRLVRQSFERAIAKVNAVYANGDAST